MQKGNIYCIITISSANWKWKECIVRKERAEDDEVKYDLKREAPIQLY